MLAVGVAAAAVLVEFVQLWVVVAVVVLVDFVVAHKEMLAVAVVLVELEQ